MLVEIGLAAALVLALFLDAGGDAGYPVALWACRAWNRGRYDSAIARMWLLAQSARWSPLISFLLTSADRADAAYAVAAKAIDSESLIADPTRQPEFAAGRAALAESDFVKARGHFAALQRRLPGSALARFALGDLSLWESGDAAEAMRLLESALADRDRLHLAYWRRLGLEAELHASHAWAAARLNKPELLLASLDSAMKNSEDSKPARASAHLRLGYALEAMGRPKSAREHWGAARDLDPEGWAGKRSDLALRQHRNLMVEDGRDLE